jgi:hypothetical protein
MTKELAQAPARARVKRTPVNGRNVLAVQGKDPTKVYRFVNDIGDRIEAFKEAGYEPVAAKDVRIGDKRVGNASSEGSIAQASVGGGTKAVLMAIPREWYDEDQTAKQAHLNELEKSMKQQALAQNELRTGKLDLTRD